MNEDEPPPLWMRAAASENSRIYQAGGDLHIHLPDPQGSRGAAVVVGLYPLRDGGDPAFVGRREQVVGLLDALDPAGQDPAAMVVSVLEGMGGVGKTVLAEHVARLAVGQQWFPGGAFMVDLQGYIDGGVEAGRVFAPMLRALGVDSDQVPAEVGEQATVYQRHLAELGEAGKRVLIVLDNVSSSTQLRHLLPNHPAHRVLVTTRDTLSLPTARRLQVQVLPEDEAIELLHRSVCEQLHTDPRVPDHAGVAGEVVRQCGCLPLAVWIAGAILASDSDMSLDDLADELADARTRLDTLVYGELGVAAAFDLSWRHLAGRAPEAARLFRLLPVNPGPEVSTIAAATLAGQAEPAVRGALRVLAQAHLVEKGTVSGRWRMHDLVHAYAGSLLKDEPVERLTATKRLLRYYHEAVPEADLGNQPGWFDIERPNLTGAVGLAEAIGEHGLAARIGVTLGGFLSSRRHFDDWVATATIACSAAQHLTDQPSIAALAWDNLGCALRNVRRFDDSIAAHRTAITLHHVADDHDFEGRAWMHLGIALLEAQRFDEAIAAHETALGIFRETSDQYRESGVLLNLANVLTLAGRGKDAMAIYKTAIASFQQTGDRPAEGMAWFSLGQVLVAQGHPAEAIAAYETMLGIVREVGDRHSEGRALNQLGSALMGLGRLDEAIAVQGSAVGIFRETSDRHREATAQNDLGTALRQAQRLPEAITAHHAACDLYQEIDDRHGEARAWGYLGLALHQAQRVEEALSAYDTAVSLFRDVGDMPSEALAWLAIGNAQRDAEQLQAAISAYQTAGDLYQRAGHRYGEGMAWASLGETLAIAGRLHLDMASSALEQAVTAFTETGAANDATNVRQLLQTIHGDLDAGHSPT